MPRKICDLEHARTHFTQLLDEAHKGRTTIITKRGRPYAALVPAARVAPVPLGPSLLALKGTGAGMWGKSGSRTVARLRGEWC